ncbi:MAG: hypothetical protein QNI87_12900 [Erythrobacter sp.]|nr:hypothetical protein [Erythrobacter sp.]MDJ0979417.1 hypothetical protein [Erythrobacter sp.]
MNRIVSQSVAAFAAVFLTIISVSAIVTVPAAQAVTLTPALA